MSVTGLPGVGELTSHDAYGVGSDPTVETDLTGGCAGHVVAQVRLDHPQQIVDTRSVVGWLDRRPAGIANRRHLPVGHTRDVQRSQQDQQVVFALGDPATQHGELD